MAKELSSKNLSFITKDCIQANIKELDQLLLKSIKTCLRAQRIKIFGIQDIKSLQSSVFKQNLLSFETDKELRITIGAPCDSTGKISDYPAVIVYKLKITMGSFVEHSLVVSSDYIEFYNKRVGLDEFWKKFSSEPEEIQNLLDVLLSSILLYWIDKARNTK